MELEFSIDHKYKVIEDSEIITANSVIYKAMDINLGRNTCIKTVSLSGNTSKEINNSLNRVLTEVRALVEINEYGAAVPQIYGTYFEEKENKIYILMQWINGMSLRDKKNISPLQYIKWMKELCDILIVMEKRNLYHKDIKPENIMIGANDKLYLIDFNISIAAPNRIEGTLHYKAPEMDVKSKYPGRDKVDIFSIGVMMYEYYTGSVPVNGIEYTKKRTRGEFIWDKFIEPKEKCSNITDDINQIIVKCMKLDPRQRYKSINELKRNFHNAERGLKYERHNNKRIF